MSEPQRNKKTIESDLSEVSRGIVEMGKAIDQAEANNNNDEAQVLLRDLVILADNAENLQKEYDKALDQEEQPERERISRLSDVISKPYVSPSPKGYAPYGFAVGTGGTATPNPETKGEDMERKREAIGELYAAPLGEGGLGAEQLPSNVRFGVGALPTPESKLEYLKRTYPDYSIAPIDVGGKTEYLLKKEGKQTLTTLDKGAAGDMGMLTVEVPLGLAEAGVTIGTGLATKSPIIATTAGAATRATLGPIADAITRAALNMPQDVGESVSRRGVEAGIGMALGLGVDVIPASVVAARVPGNFKNEFLQVYKKSVKGLGLPPSAVPAGAQFGPQGLAAAQALGGRYQRSNIAGNMRKTQEMTRVIFEGVKRGIPATANDFSSIAIKLQNERAIITREIAGANNQNVRIIEARIEEILKPLAKRNVDELGGILRGTMETAEAQAIKSTTEQYDVLAQVANDAGFQIKAEDLLNMLPSIKSRVNVGGAFDEAAVKGVENRLREVADAPELIAIAQGKLSKAKTQSRRRDLTNEIQRLRDINKPLDFKAFDAYIRAFNDARPDGAVGGTTKDVFGSGVSAELSALRKDIYSNFNATYPDGTVKNLGDEFSRATDLVRARGAFEGNTLGGILKEVVGEQAKTPRDIVASVMKEPATIDRVLKASRELEAADPTQAGVTDKLQQMMRLQYFDNLSSKWGSGVSRLNYDQGMLESLYSDKGAAAAAARGLDSLNVTLKKLKLATPPKMTPLDVDALSSALGEDARNEVAKNIIRRDALVQKENRLIQSFIFKNATKGNFENVDPDLLSKAILSRSSTVGQAKSAMAKLSQLSVDAKNLFEGDFMRNLLDEYPGGTPSANAPYTPLFGTKKFIANWESPTGKSQFAQKLEVVLGRKKAENLYNLAKVHEGNTLIDFGAKTVDARVVGSPTGGTIVLPIIPIISDLRNRYITAMLSTGSDRYGLKKALARNALPGEVNDIYVKMFNNTFMTREGIMALSHQASSDPEFSAELQNAMIEFDKKEGLQIDRK